ncbi:MAG: thiamine phosphate synthase [Planctomycetota bacterium]|nr:thiamine phosphate synthase [Planctomycetota bacterium]MDA0918946.1 thiamine phosphate synthase [Planctomycetota bacterium]
MMQGRSLTEGSRRAVEVARRQAAEWKHPEVLPAHLLWAMFEEESHAFELLELAGVTRANVEQRDLWNGYATASTTTRSGDVEISADEAPRENLSADDVLEALTRDVAAVFKTVIAENVPDENVPAENESLAEVHRLARQTARNEGRDVETSSLHLLAAIIQVDRNISAFLFEFGVTAESFKPFDGKADELAEPMPVSFEIDLQSVSTSEQTTILRILDASANRAREGLRVVEDFVRFSLDDAHLSELLKKARHQLRSVLQDFDQQSLIDCRNTRADVGTRITTSAEMIRSDLLSVVKASLKRVQEATRTLEEYSKVLPVSEGKPAQQIAAQKLEQLRYELYSIEKAVLTTVDSRQRFGSRNVYLLLSSDQCVGDVEHVLAEAIAGGVRIVQIREKSLPDRELLAFARRVRNITRESGTLLIMNDRPDLAVLCEADGVHVGQEELSVRDVRRIVGPNCLIGVSTHSIEQARNAVLDGASCIGVGPVFPSGTKSFDRFAGLEFVREVAAEIQLPWFPIGGIDLSNVDAVVEAGASRVAVSGAVCRSENPRHAAEQLVARLSSH